MVTARQRMAWAVSASHAKMFEFEQPVPRMDGWHLARSNPNVKHRTALGAISTTARSFPFRRQRRVCR